MGFGLDYTNGPSMDVLKSHGVTFACRYTGYFSGYDDTHPERAQSKVLTPQEAKLLASAGISVVSNYEWYANRALEAASSGAWDAQEALKIHLACGGPKDRPIYFSVDCDCAGEQTANYFRGVASVLGLGRTGAYGSYRVIKYLLDNHLISWAWQTYAWSYDQWDSRAHIRQYQNRVNLAGASVDYNESRQPDFGQWMPGQSIGEIEPMLQLTDPMGKFFTSNAAGDRWHCTKTNQDIAYALLTFYRQHNGEFGLPVTGEIYLQQFPQTAIQYCERAIMVYDANHAIDQPPGASSCYLLHIDSGIGQQAIAKPLLTTLQTQADTLAKQVATLTDELAQAQQKPDTSALEQQIADLTTQLTSYKQTVSQVEAALTLLPK